MTPFLTCAEAELALSRRLDGELPRAQRRPLRLHLRACEDCAEVAESERARRELWRSIAAVPLPASLESFGGAEDRAPRFAPRRVLALRTAAALAGGALIAGAGYELASRAPSQGSSRLAQPPAKAQPVIGLAASERDARGEAAVERSVGLARGEEKARALAARHVHEAAPRAAVGLARSERKARNDAKRGEHGPT